MTFEIGDLVVLKSGSMRMCVEGTSEEAVQVVWCHEGTIGRDSFAPALLNKWEHREESGGRGSDRGPRNAGGGKPWGGDREGGGRPFRGGGDRDGGGKGHRGDRGGDRGGDDRPPRKQGWDGKPRDKKYYRPDN